MPNIQAVAELIKKSKHLTAFTGAGISVESGIPPFRGAGGLWEKYDPKYIELDYFYANPAESWREMKRIFFNNMHEAQPNKAHNVLADLEDKGLLKGIITQNIDNLHQKAGNKKVQEFHGTINYLTCTLCNKRYPLADVNLDAVPPLCACGAVLKPDFTFYGEGINSAVYDASVNLALNSDIMLVVGTSGEVMPACSMPVLAKRHNNAIIIEVNTLPSAYTGLISDYYFEEKASAFFTRLEEALKA